MKINPKYPKVQDEPQIWYLSFADLVSLLLTFFILLYSMSTFDEKKFEIFGKSITSTLKNKKNKDDALKEAAEINTELRAFQMLISVLNLENAEETFSKIEKIYNADKEKKYLKNHSEEIKDIKDLSKQFQKLSSQEENLYEIILPIDLIFEKKNNLFILKKEKKEFLTKIFNFIKQHIEKTKIEICSYGFYEDNSWLYTTQQSLELAKVMSLQGIEGQKISIKGMGSTNPIVHNLKNKENYRIHILLKNDWTL